MVLNRLNASRDLVIVRDNTSDEAGFGLVEDTHQVIQLALEVGGTVCLSKRRVKTWK